MEVQPLALDADVQALPPGTKIGPWLLKGWRGRGTYGTVYRAVREGDEQGREVALKLAVHPRDARFKREAELLRRGRHPSVPQLLDEGEWQHPNGFVYPFIVMSWVEGEGLYEWAARRNPSSRQVMGLLGQAAGALHTTHEAGGVHRDVKGGNALVRPADGRLFQMDFGAGNYKGAERLTSSPLPPGTHLYRSPEAWEFDLHQGWRHLALYVAGPADDVFALGVMAYRLVTDEYPPLTDGIGCRSPREVNPRVDRRLDALIQRMLSPEPEERGTAKELAEELERACEQEGPEADAPLFEWETVERPEWPQEGLAAAEELGHRVLRRDREVVRVAAEADAARRAEAERLQARAPSQAAPRAEHGAPREWSGPGLLWLAAVMVLASLVLWWPRHKEPERTHEELAVVREVTAEEKGDGGVTYVGDNALMSSYATMKAPADRGIAQEVPPKPQPGQLKPDAKGQCHKGYVAINGGCWLKADVSLEECKAIGFEYRGGCYAPIFPPMREPTSAPMKRAGPER